MKRASTLQIAAVWLAVAGLLAPTSLLTAADPPQPVSAPVPAPVASTPTDVELAPGGVFVVKLVDQQGVALAGEPVVVSRFDRQVAQAVTGQDGSFQVGSLVAGIYVVQAPQAAATYRLWEAGTAPPAAPQTVMLVSGGQTVRGQIHRKALVWPRVNRIGIGRTVVRSPWFIAGAIGTSIALPIGLKNDEPTS